MTQAWVSQIGNFYFDFEITKKNNKFKCKDINLYNYLHSISLKWCKKKFFFPFKESSAISILITL